MIYMLNLLILAPLLWILLFIPAIVILMLKPKWLTAILTAKMILLIILGTELLNHREFFNEYKMYLFVVYIIGLLLYMTFTLVYLKQVEITKCYKTLAYTDALTNIHNRRYLEQFLQRSHDIDPYPLACIMIDIDYFKKINDTYGHDIGDQVIIHLVRIVQDVIDHTGHFIRMGGEEFLIIMTNYSTEEAALLANEIRHKVEITPYHHHEHLIPMTISLGVTSIHQQSRYFLHQVSTALLQAKKNGRNQVIIY